MDKDELTKAAQTHAAEARALWDAAKSAGRELSPSEATRYQNHYDMALELKAKADRLAQAKSQHAAIDAIAYADDMGEDATAGGRDYGYAPQGKTGQPGSHWAKSVLDQLGKTNASLGTKALLQGTVRTPSAVAVVDLPALPTNLLDLVPRERLDDTNVFAYARQILRDEHADVVADLAQKPTSYYTFEDVEDRCRVIAHLSEPLALRMFSDHASMMRILADQMQAGVERKLEQQVVSGTGTDEQFKGLLATTGVRQVAFKTDLLSTIRNAGTQLALAAEKPTAIVMNPLDAEVIDLMREAGTTGGFLVNDAVASRIFGPGVARVQSNAIPQGQAVLGNWNMAKLIVREDASTLAATQGIAVVNGEQRDLFSTNAAVIRAEGRYGFQVLRPSAFAVIDLTA